MEKERKLYFKVYQDKEEINAHYVIPANTLKSEMDSIKEVLTERDMLGPVYEPVMMTEEEFKALPEFEGF